MKKLLYFAFLIFFNIFSAEKDNEIKKDNDDKQEQELVNICLNNNNIEKINILENDSLSHKSFKELMNKSLNVNIPYALARVEVKENDKIFYYDAKSLINIIFRNREDIFPLIIHAFKAGRRFLMFNLESFTNPITNTPIKKIQFFYIESHKSDFKYLGQIT